MIVFLLSLLICTNLLAVVKGSPTKNNEWSTIVRINYEGSFKRCSGTLISANTVLTAAHCLVKVDGSRLVARDGFQVFVESKWGKKYYSNIKAVEYSEWYLNDVENNSFKTMDLRSNHDIGFIILKNEVDGISFFPPIKFSPPESSIHEKHFICGYGLSFRDKRYFLGNSTFRAVKSNLKNDKKTKHFGVAFVSYNSELESLETMKEDFSKGIQEQLKSYMKYGQRFFSQTAPGDSGSSLQTLNREIVGVANLGKWELKKGHWVGGLTLTRNITNSTFVPMYIEKNRRFLEKVFELGGSFETSD